MNFCVTFQDEYRKRWEELRRKEIRTEPKEVKTEFQDLPAKVREQFLSAVGTDWSTSKDVADRLGEGHNSQGTSSKLRSLSKFGWVEGRIEKGRTYWRRTAQ